MSLSSVHFAVAHSLYGMVNPMGMRQHLGIVFLSLTSLLAGAQTTLYSNSLMPVRMEVVAACSVSVSDLEFGSYTSNSTTPVHGQTTIQLLCAPGTTAEIALDAGAAPVGNTLRRNLQQESGNDRMDYDLFQDAGRTIHWGDRSGNDTKEVLTADAPLTVPIYGEIPGGQRVRDGTYSDVITISVSY
jgi:spore coat protein U-like protein